MPTTLNLNLSKGVVEKKIANAGLPGLRAKVILVFDISASMRSLYARGVVQNVFDRLVPIAMAMDDDGSADVYAFQDNCTRIRDVLTPNNFQDYVSRHITNLPMGGTRYSPAIQMVMDDFLGDKENVELTEAPTSGLRAWASRLVGMGEKFSYAHTPAYVMYFTDGDCNREDKPVTERLLVQASKHGLFWQFIGIEGTGGDFHFLENLDTMEGRARDNANLLKVHYDELTSKTDEQLYGDLLVEFPGWVRLAMSANIIKKQP
jgi:hypothetical protein